MAIRSITTHPLRIPYDVGGPKQEFLGRPREFLEALFLRVETTDGVVGWGEPFGINTWPVVRTVLDQFIAPFAQGRDEDDIAGLTLDLKKRLHVYGRTGPMMYAISGLDIALWDIAGKKAGKPLHALLGGAKRTALSAYASLMRYGEPDALARNCARAVQLGYRSVKLHETSVALTRVAREAVGPGIGLMLDTNCAWTPQQAMGFLPELEALKLDWLEEPTWPPEDTANLRALASRTQTLLSAGENAATPWELRQLAASGAVSIIQPSVVKIGGVTEMQALLESPPTGVRIVPHSPYFGPGYLASLHLVATMEQDTPVERLFCDFDAHPYAEQIAVDRGRVAVPQGPGLGADPDPELLARFAA